MPPNHPHWNAEHRLDFFSFERFKVGPSAINFHGDAGEALPVFKVEVVEGCRAGEDSASTAARLAATLSQLETISPSFRGWHRQGIRNRSAVPLLITMPPQITELRNWVDENRTYDKRDGRKAHVGYMLSANVCETQDFSADFRLLDQFDDGYTWVIKKFVLTVNVPKVSPERLCRIVRPGLLALVMAWDPEWAAVAPGNAVFLNYPGGWMVYLDRERAERIVEPRDVVVEKLQNGGVLLTATEELFDVCANAAHQAAANRIQDALAPLNVGARTVKRPIMLKS